MAFKQPFVIRAYFNSLADAERAMDQLESIDVYGDAVVSAQGEPHAAKVIFTDTNSNLAKTSLRRIATRPAMVQVFDVFDTPEGWPDFRPLNIS